MEKIEKTIRYNKLFNAYKSLLSTTQQEILEAYFCFDLSLGEIAENRGISRAAVDDALQKGINKLEEYETSLKLAETKEEILKITAKLKKSGLNSEQKQDIEAIERRLD